MVQRVAVCRGTNTLFLQTHCSSFETDGVPNVRSPAVCVGLSPSSPLGKKPPFAQSSMGLTWSSGLSESQGEKVFSARILAI